MLDNKQFYVLKNNQFLSKDKVIMVEFVTQNKDEFITQYNQLKQYHESGMLADDTMKDLQDLYDSFEKLQCDTLYYLGFKDILGQVYKTDAVKDMDNLTQFEVSKC